ncbi:hemolysin family protein [Cryobacterium tagatosivorans]|uniref:HlyC/CorC family transporter n=1 Tax=Cryobacterium tagatosivorans TaxID=1259199 RepID=A0A4R8UC97_9MICO|nr:hemolysin family protein [Cryobacterium tagatosivorans]TFB47817.1 HlyC/CorC family transporter [Cryobacterium tagatosivorans]
MDAYTWVNLVLVLLFVLIGGVFAATEIALVSLRESQLHGLRKQGTRGAKVASLARDPNRFLAAVQIGVTVAGFLSAAYGASTLAPDVAPLLEALGLSTGAADVLALIGMTLLIAYLSLVLGELVPKRLALQRAAAFSLALAPPLLIFASLMRPVIWFLSVSTNAVVRIFGGDPHARKEEMSVEELRDLLGAHPGLEVDERKILGEVLTATDRTVREVMRHRADVAFLTGTQTIPEAIGQVRVMPYTRYPLIGQSVDDVIGFVHVRDLLDPEGNLGARTVADLARPIVFLPGTNRILPAMTQLRRAGVHMAVVIDEYGGTDGIVTLEDLVEELVGEMRDERDAPEAEAVRRSDESGAALIVDGSVNIEDFAELTGIELEDGPYETAAGFITARLGRLPVVGDTVTVGARRLRVAAMERLRITAIEVLAL